MVAITSRSPNILRAFAVLVIASAFLFTGCKSRPDPSKTFNLVEKTLEDFEGDLKSGRLQVTLTDQERAEFEDPDAQVEKMKRGRIERLAQNRKAIQAHRGKE